MERIFYSTVRYGQGKAVSFGTAKGETILDRLAQEPLWCAAARDVPPLREDRKNLADYMDAVVAKLSSKDKQILLDRILPVKNTLPFAVDVIRLLRQAL